MVNAFHAHQHASATSVTAVRSYWRLSRRGVHLERQITSTGRGIPVQNIPPICKTCSPEGSAGMKKMANQSSDIKHVFVCGLPRSGTSLLGRNVARLEGCTGFKNTGVLEDEGQFL